MSGGPGFGVIFLLFWLLLWKVLIREVWEIKAGIYVAVKGIYRNRPGVGFGPAFQGGVWAGLMIENLVLYEADEVPIVAELWWSAFGGLFVVVILLSDISGIAPMVYEVFACMPIAATIELIIDGGQTTSDIACKLFFCEAVLVLLYVKPVHVGDFRHLSAFFPFMSVQGIGRGRRGARHTKQAFLLYGVRLCARGRAGGVAWWWALRWCGGKLAGPAGNMLRISVERPGASEGGVRAWESRLGSLWGGIPGGLA